jgi:glycosyltransferase 2 family protein
MLPVEDGASGVRASSGKRRMLMIIAIVGIAIYGGIAIGVDAPRLVSGLRRLAISGCMLVIALSVINYLLRFFRWQFYLAHLGRHLPMLRHLLYYLGGLAFTVSPAKAGEAVRALYLREHGVGVMQSMAALFAERLLDLLSMTALAGLIAMYSDTYRPLLFAIIVGIAMLLILVTRPALPAWLRLVGGGKRRDSVAPVVLALANLLESSRRLLTPSLVAFGFALGLLSWGAEGVGFHLICQGLGVSLTLQDAVGIYAVAMLAGGIALFLPGGIGGMELVMTSLLVARGAPVSTALIATLLCRLATLWLAVAMGIAAAGLAEMTLARTRLKTV